MVTKIKTRSEIIDLAKRFRADGKKIVTTNGCFDIIHPGHVANLEFARSQGDVLIVGVNSDASVRTGKGDKRPIVPERNRALVLAGLGAVDYVFIFDEKSPIAWIPELRPHVHIKGAGSETSPAFAGEKAVVEKAGGEMRIAPAVAGLSTTNIIEEVLKKYRE